MYPSDHLFQLIKSLDKSEKRHFKIYLISMKKGNFFIFLFDSIDQQKKYNEEKLIQKLKKKTEIKSFAVRKTQLHQLILKVMVNLHSEKTAAMQARNLLSQVEFLMEKKQFKTALQIIKKGKKICNTNELLEYLLDFQKAERLVHWKVTDILWLEKNIKPSYDSSRETLRVYENLTEYHSLAHRLQIESIKKHKGLTHEDDAIYKEIMTHELMEEDKTLSVKAKLIYYHINLVSSYMLRDYDRSLFFSQKTRELFENIPGLIEKDPPKYLYALNNVVTMGMKSLRKEELKDILSTIKGLSKYDSIDKRNILVRYYAGTFEVTYNFSDYKQLPALIENEIGPFLKEYPAQSTDNQFIGLCLNICFFYLAINSVKHALKWFNKFEQYLSANAYENYLPIFRIIQVLLHAELENWTLVNSLIRAANRKALNANGKLKLEEELFSFFKNTYPKIIYNKAKYSEEFKALKVKLIVTLNNPNYEHIKTFFDFIAWCDSKIENKPLIEILKRKARKG